MRVLVATFNKGKQEEYREMLERLAKDDKADVKLFFPADFKLKDEVKETGKTFEENSLLKAKYFFKKVEIPTIADDGGLEIEALGGEPGVKSRRWLGYEGTDEELIKYALEKLKKYKSEKNRSACLKTCVTFFDGENTIQETDKIEGYIAKEANERRVKGYPFRALFVVIPLGKYYDKLSKEEHKNYNHREKALQRLWPKLKLLYNI